jgi:predicted Zn-dependent peptidase
MDSRVGGRRVSQTTYRTTLEDVRSFYAKHYGPNHAVLAVVGDVDAGRTGAVVGKYFADIPARATPPAPDTTGPPSKTSAVKVCRLPPVTMQIVIRDAGGDFDPPGQGDLARVTAEMMREGSGASADISFRAPVCHRISAP